MVVIRLARGGAKKRPFYHIVVTDRRNKRDGRYLERIGYFNPVATGGETRLSMDEERFTHWRSQGAQPSTRVHSLFKDFKRGPEVVAAKREQAKAQKDAALKAAEEAKAKAEADAKAAEEAKAKAEADAKAFEEAKAASDTSAEESPKNSAEQTPSEDQSTASDEDKDR